MVTVKGFIAALKSIEAEYGGDVPVAVNYKPDEILFDIGISSINTGEPTSDLFGSNGVCIITLGTVKNTVVQEQNWKKEL